MPAEVKHKYIILIGNVCEIILYFYLFFPLDSSFYSDVTLTFQSGTCRNLMYYLNVCHGYFHIFPSKLLIDYLITFTCLYLKLSTRKKGKNQHDHRADSINIWFMLDKLKFDWLFSLPYRAARPQHHIRTVPKIGETVRKLFEAGDELINHSTAGREARRLLAVKFIRTKINSKLSYQDKRNWSQSTYRYLLRPKLW